MAEAKLVSKNGEIFTVKNGNDGASSKTMKDLISSVRYVQSKINDKLTEFVNDEKDTANGNMKDSKENSEAGNIFADNEDEYEDESDDDEESEPAVKKNKTEI